MEILETFNQWLCRKKGHKEDTEYQPFAMEKRCTRCGEYYDEI